LHAIWGISLEANRNTFALISDLCKLATESAL
jgi:hypothetical protein